METRWVEFMVNTGMSKPLARWRAGQVVELDAELARTLVMNGHCLYRRDLELARENAQETGGITKPSEPDLRDLPAPRTEAQGGETKEAGNVPVAATSCPPGNNAGLRDDWISLREACELMGWIANGGAQNKIKSACLSGKLIHRVLEGEKPAYLILRTSLEDYKAAYK